MSGKKKAFIAPKYQEQASLYEKLKRIRDVTLAYDQVENHIGPGPTIIKEAGTAKTETTPGRTKDSGPTSDPSGSADSSEQTGSIVQNAVKNKTNIFGKPMGQSALDFIDPERRRSSLSSSYGGESDALDWALSGDEEDVDSEDEPVTPDVSAEGEYIRALPSNSGIYHTVVPMKSLNFNIAQDESVIQHGGSYIVLGTDRPTSNRSGYGAKGYQNASSIDLVVGRLSSARGIKGPADGTLTDNNPAADAARVYISQLSDIDVMFGLDGGVSGVASGGSAVALKADDIRIIGQRSVKIVTGNSQGVRGAGRKGEYTSLGYSMHQPAPTIELLAGNRLQERKVWGGIRNPVETISTVQRACLGGNTRDAFVEMNELLGEVWSAVFNLALIQAGYNANLGVDPFRPWVAAAAPVVGIANLDAVLNSLWHTKMNAILWEMNYLTPYGYKFVCSTNIKLS